MSDYTELQKAAAYAAQDAIKFADEDEEIRALQQFHEEFDPETVLALIAENEELGRYLCTCRDCGGEGALHTGDWHSYGHMEPPEPVMEKCGECEGTGLLGKIQDLYQVITERDQLKADNERLRADYAGLARFNPEWDRVAAAQDSVREHMAMVVQLKAEVAGLRTGYEAYERVNAELKAENERLVPFEEAYRTACNVRNRLINEGEELRKALAECGDSLQGEMLQKFGGQLPEDMHPVTRRDYDRDMAELAGYRAAIGKGEQS